MRFAVRAIYLCLIALTLTQVGQAQDRINTSTPPANTEPVTKPAPNKTSDGLSDARVLAPGERVVVPSVPTASFEPSLYLKGLTFLQSGEYPQAVEMLRKAVEQNPNDAVAYGKLGVAYAALKQYKEAVVVLKMAIHIKPAVIDAEDYYQLSNAYNVLEKYSQAYDAIKLALYIKRAERAESGNENRFPTCADLHYSAALSLYNLRRYHDALEELKQVIEANPKHVLGHFGIAVTYLATGDYTAAEKEQQLLESLDPGLAAKVAKVLAQRSQNPQGMVFIFKTQP